MHPSKFTAAAALSVALLCTGCEFGPSTVLGAYQYERTLDSYSQEDTTQTDVTAREDATGRPATLLSAFYGLDDALPGLADRVICDGASGKDGMPVIFSHEVDPTTIEPGDFRIVTASGKIGEITCLTFDPASDTGELRTALLTGQYGSADDEPVTVEIVGNVLSKDGQVNFKDAKVDVTPLKDGPSLVLAEIVPPKDWEMGSEGTSLPFAGGTGCPASTLQIVRAIWAGGITKPGGGDVDDTERQEYRIRVVRTDGSEEDVTPFALGDLGDGDNNHKLCLDTKDPAISVSFPAGLMTDPREDLNPATTIAIAGSQSGGSE